ncbi:putative hemicentin-1-like, partial [Apostichopus japonicus]
NTVQRQTKLAKVGFSTEITCSIDFLDRNYFVIWYKNGKYLFEHEPRMSLNLSRDGRIYTRNEQEDIALLRIQNVSVRDAGEYHCKAVHTSVGKPMFHYWKINVQDGPILSPIRSVRENETFSAQCCVTFTYSTEPVKYLWSIGNPLTTTFSDNFGGNLTCSNVSFTAVRAFHNKLVVCTVENELNSSTHERINLMLPPTMKLQINGHDTNATAVLANGTHVNITCYAIDSTTKAYISWNCNEKTCPSEGSLSNDMHEKLNNATREFFTADSTINYTAMQNEDVICTAGIYGDRNWTKSVKISVF